jgi:hypothetical protein
MATAREDLAASTWRLRPMAQADLARVAALERQSYVFPWNDQIFADCLRVGYHCVVVDTAAAVAGYGVLSMGGGRGARPEPSASRRNGAACGVGALSCSRSSRTRAIVACATRSSRCAGRTARRSRSITISGFECVGTRRGYYQARMAGEDALVLPPRARRARDMTAAEEIARRRTSRIISHPDAGKTTLTEKLLLFGGAIQMAGTVKAARPRATRLPTGWRWRSSAASRSPRR